MVAAGDSLERCTQSTGVARLSVLPSGPVPLNPSEIYAGPELAATIRSLRNRYDRVIVDGPSVLSGDDVAALGRIVDDTLMVVGAYQTSREEAVAAKEFLGALGIPVGGVILNRARDGRYPALQASVAGNGLRGEHVEGSAVPSPSTRRDRGAASPSGLRR